MDNQFMNNLIFFLSGFAGFFIIVLIFYFITTKFYKSSKENIIKKIMLLIEDAIKIESKKFKASVQINKIYLNFEKILNQYITEEAIKRTANKPKLKPINIKQPKLKPMKIKTIDYK